MIPTLLGLTLLFLNIVCLISLFLRHRKTNLKTRTYAFFHPYCNAGGGGEKVLWAAIRCIQERYPDVKCVVYTGELDVTPDEIIATAERRFHVRLSRPVEFIYIRSRSLLEAKNYKFLTLLLQSGTSTFVALESILKLTPHVYIDTTGFAFTLLIFKFLGGCKTVSYVHYPTISTDMLCSVQARRRAIHNSDAIAHSTVLTYCKLLYYRCFAYLYGWVGNVCGDVTMVNSSWTLGHISEIWGTECHLVYPPCAVEEFQELESKANPSEEFRIVSLAQFRPEKDHTLQLNALKIVQQKLKADDFKKIKLVLIGSCRDEADEQRIEDLKIQANFLEIQNNVEFLVDIPFPALKLEMQKGTAAIHSMWNEHFGIAVVECMAAGLIMIAHDSGGPQMDIVDAGCGFRASNATEYATMIIHVFRMPDKERKEISAKARSFMQRFNEKSFDEQFSQVFDNYVEKKIN